MPSRSIPLKFLGCEPVAIMIFLHSKICPSASILCSDKSRASVFKTSTLRFLSESSRPFLNFSTTRFLCSITSAKSKVTLSA